MLTARDPLRSLQELGALRAELDAYEREQVRRALETGSSFAAVARAVGITRQAAHRRYRHLLSAPAPAPRLVASSEALAVLQRARHEAARVGASAVDGEHVLLALRKPDGARGAAGGPPIGRHLLAALARIGGPIGVEELERAASEDSAARLPAAH